MVYSMEKTYPMVATTMFGLEKILEKELLQIGAKKVSVGNRCVYFYGDKLLMYKANLQLRTALKILKNLVSFKAKKETELYSQISRIKWHTLFETNKTFSVSSTVNSTYFTHSNYVSLVVKDAIVDQFRKKKNQRPSIDLKNPDFNIHIHISHNQCHISLNSSGSSLHKRGYRSKSFNAPINEVLAAGIVMLSDWGGKHDLIDPMCGSGTILIEAALIAINRAPNIYRKSFNFQNWKNYDHNMFEKIKTSIQKEETICKIKIQGFDISASAISIARNHISNVRLSKIIQISGQDFFNSNGKENTLLIMNPPYGKRIQLTKDYYKQIGDTLKKKYINTQAWIISSELQELKTIGLRTSKKIKLFNGPLECRLLKFELYKGSKKLVKLNMSN